MLRWKIRYTPLFVTALLIVAAVMNAKGGWPINLGW